MVVTSRNCPVKCRNMYGPHGHLLSLIEWVHTSLLFYFFLLLCTLHWAARTLLCSYTCSVCVQAWGCIDSWAGLNPLRHRLAVQRKEDGVPENVNRVYFGQVRKFTVNEVGTPSKPVSNLAIKNSKSNPGGSTVICELGLLCEMFSLPRRMAGEGLSSASPAFAFLCNYGKCIQCARVSLLSCCFIISLWDNVDFGNEMQI